MRKACAAFIFGICAVACGIKGPPRPPIVTKINPGLVSTSSAATTQTSTVGGQQQ